MRIKIKDLSGFVLNYLINTFLADKTYKHNKGRHIPFEVLSEGAVVRLRNYVSDRHNFVFNIAKAHPLFTEARISRTIDHSGLWIAYYGDGYSEEKQAIYCDKSEIVAGLKCWLHLHVAAGNNLDLVVDIPDDVLKALQYIEANEPLLYQYRSQREYIVEDMKGKFARVAIPRGGELPRTIREMANTVYNLHTKSWEKYRWFIRHSFEDYLAQHCIMFESIPLASRLTMPGFNFAYECKKSGFYCGHIFQPTNKE